VSSELWGYIHRLRSEIVVTKRDFNIKGREITQVVWDSKFSRLGRRNCWASGLCRRVDLRYKRFGWMYCLFRQGLRCSMFIRNVVICLKVHTALLPRRPTSAWCFVLRFHFFFLWGFVFAVYEQHLTLQRRAWNFVSFHFRVEVQALSWRFHKIILTHMVAFSIVISAVVKIAEALTTRLVDYL
jgi:hypothetical protein